MTLLEHCYAIRALLSKGIASKDTQYNISHIAHFLNVARALFTEQKADKYRFISEQSFQSLCVPLEKGSLHNCCDITDTTCTLLKSKTKLPKFLNTRWGDFAKVMTLSGEIISKTTITQNRYSKYSLNRKTPKTGWFIHDGYLYILNNTNLDTVLLNSLFDNPSSVDELNCASSQTTECKDIYDYTYPIDPDLIDPVYKRVLEYFSYSLNLPPKDIENNAKDDQVSS
jgi:hypothetical protein